MACTTIATTGWQAATAAAAGVGTAAAIPANHTIAAAAASIAAAAAAATAAAATAAIAPAIAIITICVRRIQPLMWPRVGHQVKRNACVIAQARAQLSHGSSHCIGSATALQFADQCTASKLMDTGTHARCARLLLGPASPGQQQSTTTTL